MAVPKKAQKVGVGMSVQPVLLAHCHPHLVSVGLGTVISTSLSIFEKCFMYLHMICSAHALQSVLHMSSFAFTMCYDTRL